MSAVQTTISISHSPPSLSAIRRDNSYEYLPTPLLFNEIADPSIYNLGIIGPPFSSRNTNFQPLFDHHSYQSLGMVFKTRCAQLIDYFVSRLRCIPSDTTGWIQGADDCAECSDIERMPAKNFAETFRPDCGASTPPSIESKIRHKRPDYQNMDAVPQGTQQLDRVEHEVPLLIVGMIGEPRRVHQNVHLNRPKRRPTPTATRPTQDKGVVFVPCKVTSRPPILRLN